MSRKKSLSQRIYEAVIQDIIKGVITQDSVLTESGLIKQYQVSKSPVRDALMRLCQEDVLTSVPRFGYLVKGVDLNYFKEIILFRSKIETHYLSHYFHKVTHKDCERIEETILPFLEGDYDTPMEYWHQASFFHLALAASYQDRFFTETLQNVLNKQLITFSKLYWDAWSSIRDSKMQDKHSAVLVAIKQGQKDLAVAALEEDILTV